MNDNQKFSLGFVIYLTIATSLFGIGTFTFNVVFGYVALAMFGLLFVLFSVAMIINACKSDKKQEKEKSK